MGIQAIKRNILRVSMEINNLHSEGDPTRAHENIKLLKALEKQLKYYKTRLKTYGEGTIVRASTTRGLVYLVGVQEWEIPTVIRDKFDAEVITYEIIQAGKILKL